MALTHATLVLLLSAASAFPNGPDLPFTVLPISVGSDWSETSLYRVFRTEEEFLAHWPRSHSCDDSCARALIASIDFARNMMVVIAPRGRGQDTREVALTAVTDSQDTIDVTFLELRGGQSRGETLCISITSMPTPIALIAIPQSDRPVRFFRRLADVFCDESPVEVQ